MLAGILKKGRAKSYSYSFMGNLLSSASQWVVLMLIAKLYGTTQMGYYALALAWTLPLYALFSLQLRNIHVADQTNTYGFNLLFQIRAGCALMFFFTVSAIGFLFYRHIVFVFIVTGLFKSFEMISDVIHAEFHKRKQIVVYSKMLMFRSILAILLNLFMFSLIPWFDVALISLPVAYLCSMTIDFHLLKKLNINIRFELNNPLERKIISTGVLTGLSLLMVYMLPNIPRFVLEKFRDSFELGLFSGYLSLVIFTRIFVQSVVQNSLPYLAQHFDENDLPKFLSRLKKEACVITGLGLLQFLLVPVSGYLFPLLFNKDFKGNETLLCLIFTGSTFSFLAFVLNNGINAMKMFSIQLPVYAVMVTLSIGMALFLIPRYGLNGAALSIIVVNVSVCATLFSVILSKLQHKEKLVSELSNQVQVCQS